jgi:toxin ParE1/3/4
MTAKPVIRRAQAQQDITDAITYYLEQEVPDVAEGFISAMEKAIGQIARHPASGSPRYAGELGLPELRFCQLNRYPFLIFYIEQNDHIDVWRILHSQRDIPEWMRVED